MTREFQPVRTRPVRSHRPSARLSPADAFTAGFYGGLGVWVAFVLINAAALAVLALVVIALGGLGALLEALR